MKYTIAILLILLFSIASSAQNIDSFKTCMYKSGVEFDKFQKQHGVGTGISILGGAICMISLVTDASNTKSGAVTHNYGGVYAGGAVMLIGCLVSLNSYKHIGKAAFFLKGNGVSMIINKSHKKKSWQ